MSVTVFQAWVSITLSSVMLFSVIFGVLKVLNQNTAEWKVRELRIQIIEAEIVVLKNSVSDLGGIKVKLGEVATEMARIRDRLDRFLDGPRMASHQ